MNSEVEFKTMSLEEAWNFFKTEIEMNSVEYQNARFGIYMMFDINDYFYGHISVKSKTGKVFIRGKSFKTEDFYTELEHRERQIKSYLVDNFSDEEIAAPRGIALGGIAQ